MGNVIPFTGQGVTTMAGVGKVWFVEKLVVVTRRVG